MTVWYKDFIWSWHGVTVRETGAKVAFNPGLIKDLYVWGSYTIAEKLRNITFQSKPLIAVYPGTIRPWYLLWAIITRSGAKITGLDQADKAKLAVHFEDKTETTPTRPPDGIRTINFACTDISKSMVSETFKDVFGYDLSIDPARHTGPMVRKSEENGAHDGKIIKGPCSREDGWVYQKVIDNRTDDNHVADLRCPTLFGAIDLVFIKERPFEQRFENLNTRCTLKNPDELFSEDELAKISRFCHKMKLDFGGLDILRDNQDGRIYIVDVNKTDMGPPFALPLRQKLKAVDILAKQFKSVMLTE